MKANGSEPQQMPDVAQLEAELQREKYKKRYKRVLRSTVYTLIVVTPLAVQVESTGLPVLQI